MPLTLLPLAAAALLAQTDLSRLDAAELIERLPRARAEGPASEESLEAALELGRRLERGDALSDAEWLRALTVSGAIHWRERWPADQPFAVSLQVPPWLGRCSLRVVGRRPGWVPAEAGGYDAECGFFAAGQMRGDLYQALGTLARGAQRVEVDVVVMEQRVRRSALWEGILAFDVQVVPTIEDVLPAASDDASAAGVRDALGVSFDSTREGGELVSRAKLVLRPDTVRHPALVRTALSLRVEVVQDGEVVQEITLQAEADRLASGGFAERSGWADVSLPGELEWDEGLRAGWGLRVHGVADGVLRDWDAVRRWDGEVSLTLDEAARRHEERVRAALDARLERNRGR